MRRLVLLALALGLAGCGSGGDELLPGTDAAGLKDTLAEVRQAVEDRDVQACSARVEELRSAVTNLEPPVDRRLRQRLREEIDDKLAPQVADECDDPKTEQIPTTTSPGPTGPTGPAEQPQPEPEPEPTTETEKTPPTPTTGTVPTPTVEPEPTPTPPGADDPTQDPGGFGEDGEPAP